MGMFDFGIDTSTDPRSINHSTDLTLTNIIICRESKCDILLFSHRQFVTQFAQQHHNPLACFSLSTVIALWIFDSSIELASLHTLSQAVAAAIGKALPQLMLYTTLLGQML